MANVKRVQSRKMTIITYLSEDQVLSVIKNHSSQVRNFAFILHDKDVWEDDNQEKGHVKGQLKEPHRHLLLLLKYPYPLSSVDSWFEGFYDENGQRINTRPAEPMSDSRSMYRYLMHLDNPEKAQYDESCIICGDPAEFYQEDNSCEDKAFIALDLMLQGESRYNIAKRLGRDFIYHYGHIKQIFEDILKENENE